MHSFKTVLGFTLVALALIGGTGAQTRPSVSPTNHIPAPEDVLGFRPGDDRKLASWSQVIAYFQKLDAASDRVKFEELGKSTMGAPFVMATISAPENLARLGEYRKIQEQLADPRKLMGTRASSPANAKAIQVESERLIARGKTIVLITCGIHSDEVGSYLSSMLIAHRLASSNDPVVQKILLETIVLLVPSLNPDGVDIIKSWYDKTLGTPYEGKDPPELYHKYVGHDDNRDWYAFTQVETQITVDKIHNVWHPQIVHDIHQQGEFGARLFLPPYMDPVEPNVPKQIVEGYTELGTAIATEMRAAGFIGITTGTTYDAWSPSRAYSHYHGGVRILSETASANLATPITINFENLRGGIGYEAKKETDKFFPLWQGGEWHLRDITNYMTTAAFTLMNHAAVNREKWLRRFYEIGNEAVSVRKDGEISAFVIPSRESVNIKTGNMINILHRGGVEAYKSKGFLTRDGLSIAKTDYIIPLAQPYGAFAKALLEKQHYPDQHNDAGQPIPPYDATAHTLPLLMDVMVIPVKGPFPDTIELHKAKTPTFYYSISYTSEESGRRQQRIGLYKSNVPAVDEGWTRQLLQDRAVNFSTLGDIRIRFGNLRADFDVIIIPDQSPNDILNGHKAGAMPDEFIGGISPNGVTALLEFVERGGNLICLNRASGFAIEQLGLPVRDITQGLSRKEFYAPGSILRIELDGKHPISPGQTEADGVAWVENSPVFELSDKNAIERVHVVARYPSEGDPLLSGWLLGGARLRGKGALVEISVGKGRVILFGFRPQYRGQSQATYPLFFNALRLRSK